MKTRFIACLSLAFLIAGLANANAATTGDGDVEVRLLAVQLPVETGKVLLLAGENRTDPFDLPMNNLSEPVKPPGRVFQMWSQEKNVSLSTVKLPEQGNSFLVLMVPVKDGFMPIVRPHDDPEFKPGDISFLNLTDKTVLGRVGTSKFELAPAKNTILRPKGARAEKFYDVVLGVRDKDGDRVLAMTRWPEDPLARFHVFFYLDPATRLVTYRAVDEFVEPPAPDR